MPFNLRNASQLKIRLIDNALYGSLKIGESQDRSFTGSPNVMDVRTKSNQICDQEPFGIFLGSYVDHKLIPYTLWNQLYDQVERVFMY